MNILIPTFIQDHPHEGAKVFMAFLYRIMKHGEYKGIRYFIDSRDVRAIVQKNMTDPGPTFGDYTHTIRFGKCSDTHWFFEFQKEIVDTVIYEIQREELRSIWCYLVARMQGDPNIIEDWNQKGFPERTPPFLKTREDQVIFSTTGRPTEWNSKDVLRRRQERNEEERTRARNPVGRPRKNKK